MKKLMSPWWALITLFVLTAVFVQRPNFTESVKLNYFDTLITSREPIENNIYTVNIDEAALEKYGQYPFPRNIYGDIIKEIYDRGAGIVVWNIMMPEVDRFGGDEQLAKVMAEYPVILASRPAAANKNTPMQPASNTVNAQYVDQLFPYPGIISNIPELEQAAVGSGIVSTEPEIDGVNRRLPALAAVGELVYPGIALETLRVIAGQPSFDVKLAPNGIDKFRVRDHGPVATDEMGRIWIDWAQRSKQVSVTDMPADFGGAVVIVDVTAAGIANPVPTALGAKFPGEIHAAMLGTMFNKTNIQRPYWADTFEIPAAFLAGLLLILVSRWTWVGLGLTVVVGGAIVPASMYMFNTELFLLDATGPLAIIILVALHTYGIKFVREFLEKQAIKKQFAGYCSPEVVRLLQENPDLIKKGVKKDVSVMFSDLRGFTPIGEHFGHDVKGLGDYMNGYMDAITQPILNHNGMVIKYVGDASMHIQGAPLEDDNHAYNIVETGLQMLDAVDAYTKEAEARGLPPAAMGFGINSGEGFIGEMGSTARHSYDILGDMVSTAARLEARCKAYGVLCIIGAETYNRTADDFFYLYLDNLQPKGKSTPDFIYTALRIPDAGAAAEYLMAKEMHDEMHELYRNKQFKKAAILCETLKDEFDGQMAKYYKMWIERCEFMLTQKLPDDWTGAWIANEK
jgi:adenylate cyclase